MIRLALTITLLSTFLLSNSLPIKTRVDIYKNISFLTKTYLLDKTNKIAILSPSKVKLEDIEIISKCTTDKLNIKQVTVVPKKIQSIRKNIDLLQTELDNLIYQNELLKSISLKERKNQDIEEVLKLFNTKFTKNQNSIYTLRKRIKEEKSRLDELLKEQPVSKFNKIDIIFTCRDKNSKVSIKYPQYNINTKEFYNIYADTKDNSIKIVKSIKITQNTGEDLKNTDIVSHSNVYNKNMHPYPFYPRYIHKQKKRLLATSKILNTPAADASFKQYATTSAFTLKNIYLPNNKEQIFSLFNKTYRVKFLNEIDGYGTSLAYLKATFKSDIFYQKAKAYIFLNNIKIGKTLFKESKKNQTNTIYFGENQNIIIKKVLLKNFNESEFFGNKIKNTKAWLYTIKNSTHKKENIELIEKIPVSQDEDIKITPLFDTTKAKIDTKGRVVFELSLKASKSKNIKFGYEITKPKE